MTDTTKHPKHAAVKRDLVLTGSMLDQLLLAERGECWRKPYPTRRTQRLLYARGLLQVVQQERNGRTFPTYGLTEAGRGALLVWRQWEHT